MRQVRLIAVNFVREQRWPILVLMLWILVFSVLGLVVDLRSSREDVLFLYKQLAVYGIAFAVFFGASAIHNERKTRRILSVLSKSVSRGQYISGLLGGIILAVGIYCFSMAVTGTWILRPAGFPAWHVWFLMLCLMMACLLAAAIAVLFSTFLNPLFATLCTALGLGIPAVVALQFRSRWVDAVPSYSLVTMVMGASFSTNWTARWDLLGVALLEAAVFWMLASWIFSRRDIAVAVD
jgi:ABC-type transport system involved in multi-copper enzyme maturation permease subunit